MMKMKELKEIIKNLPDDLAVVIVNAEDCDQNHIGLVSSCGIIKGKFEDHDAFGLMSSCLRNIKDEIGNGEMYQTRLLFDNFPYGYEDDKKKEDIL